MVSLKIKAVLFLLGVMLTADSTAFAQDSNFYVFLSFGQSNMEGSARSEAQDSIVDARFQVLQAVDCPNLDREKGKWYTAAPPLSRCKTGLTPGDYFGRTLVANLPPGVRVGIINVSVAGCKIELFMKDSVQKYVANAPGWMSNIIKEYNGDPYAHLLGLAKQAQQAGVIKGILLHQGESNTNDAAWPVKLKTIYDRLLQDLKLRANSVPLLAGELVHADQGGKCASMNKIIATLPQHIQNAHVISSSGCTSAADKLHFDAAGYRELGTRYGLKMLSILGAATTKK
jgi:hypothetical protein